MTSFYKTSSDAVDQSIEKYLKTLLLISDNVGELGSTWLINLKAAIDSAIPGGAADVMLRKQLHTAKFLALSRKRTESRIDAFTIALDALPRPRFSNQEGQKVDWSLWYFKQKLNPQLANIAKRVSFASKAAAFDLKKHELLHRQKDMEAALEKLTKVLVGAFPIGHILVSITESTQAILNVFKGLNQGAKKSIEPLARSMDEMESFEALLLSLEKCLYLIPSSSDVTTGVFPDEDSASDRLNAELTNEIRETDL